MAAKRMITGIAPDGSLFPIDKLDAHYCNVRHKAISVFVFRNGDLLLQRRAAGKYHSGLLWTNTCCSHPLWNETPAQCARRRLEEEMGLQLELTEIGVTNYAAPVAADMFENEEVHLFVGQLSSSPDTIAFDPEEACEIAWCDFEKLEEYVAAEPDRFTVWLRAYLQAHGRRLRSEADTSRNTADRHSATVRHRARSASHLL